MPSINSLIGAVKARTDLSVRTTRIHYNETTTVPLALNRKIVFTFPRHPGGFLDMSSIYFSTVLKRTSANALLDATSFSQFFRRVVLRHGNTTLCDLDAYSIACPAQEKIHITSLTSQKERLIMGFQDENGTDQGQLGLTLDGTGKRYNIKFLKGTVLNCQALLPVDRLSAAGPLQLELYLENPTNVVRSTTATDSISFNDLDLYCDYLFSPSLSASGEYKVNFHVDDYSFRYQSLNGLRNTLRLPSSVSDLQEAMIIFRDEAKDNPPAATNDSNKLQNAVSYSAISTWQMWVDSRPWFSEVLTDDKTALGLWNEAKKCEPEITSSRYYTDFENPADAGTLRQPPIFMSLQAAPKFSDDMLSGISTTRHNIEAYVDFTFATAQPATVAAYAFLFHTSRIYEDSNGQLLVQK